MRHSRTACDSRCQPYLRRHCRIFECLSGVAHDVEEGGAECDRPNVARVQRAKDEGRPYAMAFVDMRMPPGWDGLKTIERLWATDPDVQVVKHKTRLNADNILELIEGQRATTTNRA